VGVVFSAVIRDPLNWLAALAVLAGMEAPALAIAGDRLLRLLLLLAGGDFLTTTLQGVQAALLRRARPRREALVVRREAPVALGGGEAPSQGDEAQEPEHGEKLVIN